MSIPEMVGAIGGLVLGNIMLIEFTGAVFSAVSPMIDGGPLAGFWVVFESAVGILLSWQTVGAGLLLAVGLYVLSLTKGR